MNTNIDYQSVKEIARMIAKSEQFYDGENGDAMWEDHWNWYQHYQQKGDTAVSYPNQARWHDTACEIIGYLASRVTFKDGVMAVDADTLEQEINNLSDECDALEGIVEEWKTVCEERSGEIDDLEDIISDKDREIADLNAALEESEQEVENLGFQVSELEEKTDDLEIQVEELEGKVQELEQQVSELEAELEIEPELEELDTDADERYRAAVINQVRRAMGDLRGSAPRGSFFGLGPKSVTADLSKPVLVTLPEAIEKLCDLLEG